MVLAEKCKTSTSYLGEIEIGKKFPSIEMIQKIAEAYGISSRQIETGTPIESLFSNDKPELVEILIKENTYVVPKLEFGKPNQDQEPLIDRVLYNKIMNLSIKD